MKHADYLHYFTDSPEVYAKIVASFDRTTTLFDYLHSSGILDGCSTVLSIGAGEGAVEIRLAKELGRQIGVIEPSQTYLDTFLANASSAGVSEQIIAAHNQSLQAFEPSSHYDLVVSLFSWFAFGFDQQVFEKALSCRTPTGKLLICLPERSNPMTKIAVKSRPSDVTYTSESLSAWANEAGFAHRYDVYHGVVRADQFVIDEGLTQTAKDLTAFVANAPWAELSMDVQSESLKAFAQARNGKLIDFAAGCLIFEAE